MFALYTCLCSIFVLSVRSLSLWKLNNIFKLCIGSEVRHSNASAPELPSLYTSIVPLHVPLLRFGGLPGRYDLLGEFADFTLY